MHILYSLYHISNRSQVFNNKTMRKKTLVNDADNILLFFFQPDSSVMLAIYFHERKYKKYVVITFSFLELCSSGILLLDHLNNFSATIQINLIKTIVESKVEDKTFISAILPGYLRLNNVL